MAKRVEIRAFGEALNFFLTISEGLYSIYSEPTSGFSDLYKKHAVAAISPWGSNFPGTHCGKLLKLSCRFQ
jgi:hypothetical protein